jgi:hypothetical protein
MPVGLSITSSNMGMGATHLLLQRYPFSLLLVFLVFFLICHRFCGDAVFCRGACRGFILWVLVIHGLSGKIK